MLPSQLKTEGWFSRDRERVRNWDTEQECSRHYLSAQIQTRVHHLHRSVLSFHLCFSPHCLAHSPVSCTTIHFLSGTMWHSQPRQPLPWVHTDFSPVRFPRGGCSDLPKKKKKWATFSYSEKCHFSLLMKRYQTLTLLCNLKYFCSAQNSQ